MRGIITTIFAGLALILSACNNTKSEKTPEGVTERFVSAFNTADFQNMYAYSSKKSHILLDNLAKQHNDTDLEAIRSRKIAIDSTTVTGMTDSTATCVCYFKIKSGAENDEWQSARQEWDLAKEGDDWKVLLVKP
ncbi:MAG: hypothetical protein SPL42_04805 [Bacteroidales bacterium]|nr:hypothetical protein [Bacteroidales bacterium]